MFFGDTFCEFFSGPLMWDLFNAYVNYETINRKNYIKVNIKNTYLVSGAEMTS